jgi:phospholipase/carboxylesterase
LKLALILLSVCIGFTMTSITQAADPYRAVIAGQEERVLRFLQTYETFQEELRMDQAGAQRKALFHALDTIVTELRTELYELSVPAELIEFNTRWRKILSHFDNAYMAIMTSTKEQFLQAFLRGGREFSHASYLLYALRAELPQVQQYWQLANAEMQRPIPETVNSVASIRTSVMHHRQTSTHAPYSLYVPEDYDPNHLWPLVVALHGSHGSGGEYLLTWLRAAKHHGYIILAPHSHDLTWSIEQPKKDIHSILAMLTTVTESYNIDTRRMFVSGLSDGGTFTYALGLHCPQIFAGIAPIASVLPAHYPIEHAKNLPVFIVHGAQDFTFPVTTARAAYARLQDNHFTETTYTELPDWGHAYTYSINETQVMPWFARIGKAPSTMTVGGHTTAFNCSLRE